MTEPLAAGDQFCGYAVRRESWRIGGCEIDLTWIADIDVLLDLPVVHEKYSRDQYMPYWAQPWPSAVMLAEAILKGERGRGRAAAEIGCGVGLVSVAAAMTDWSVTASDYDEDAVAFARLNAERNEVQLAGTGIIDFRTPLPVPLFERVFGADLTYERRNAAPLARWLASALLPGGDAWLTDPNRSAGDEFPGLVGDLGLRVSAEPIETTVPDGLIHRGRIWKITKPRDGYH